MTHASTNITQSLLILVTEVGLARGSQEGYVPYGWRYTPVGGILYRSSWRYGRFHSRGSCIPRIIHNRVIAERRTVYGADE